MTTRFSAQALLNPGSAKGSVLRLTEPLSFWGGFDPAEGRIVDRHHPQTGEIVTGKVLVMARSRGSAGTPAGVAESIRRELGPAAFLLTEADANLAVGAMVADRLYETATPVFLVAAGDAARLHSGDDVVIASDGTVTVVGRRAPPGPTLS